MSAYDYTPTDAQRLGQNPMLPPHPVSTAYDAQYAADEAVLRANIARSYADILQQLGYTDENGNFIPGAITANARRTRADLNRSNQLAEEEVTNQAQRQGTLFSGRRGTETARAQYPFQQAILDLGINVPLQLSQLYEQAAGLTDQYNLQNNQLLAAAAQRASQRSLLSAPSPSPGATTTSTIAPPPGGSTLPPPAPSAPSDFTGYTDASSSGGYGGGGYTDQQYAADQTQQLAQIQAEMGGLGVTPQIDPAAIAAAAAAAAQTIQGLADTTTLGVNTGAPKRKHVSGYAATSGSALH